AIGDRHRGQQQPDRARGGCRPQGAPPTDPGAPGKSLFHHPSGKHAHPQPHGRGDPARQPGFLSSAQEHRRPGGFRGGADTQPAGDRAGAAQALGRVGRNGVWPPQTSAAWLPARTSGILDWSSYPTRNQNMANIVITGANRGIGLALVRNYVANGDRVYALCRRPDQATDLNQIATSAAGRLTLHQTDLANGNSNDANPQALCDP